MTTPLPQAAGRVAAATAALLLLPAFARLFTAEVNWGPGDYLVAAVLLFGAGMTYVLAARHARTKQQRGVAALLVLTALALVWAELAVGLFH